MKRLYRLLCRACLLVMIRSLERELHDQMNALGHVRSVNDFKRISLSAADTRRHLAHYRAEYTALLPVGTRKTWANA